MGNKRKKLLTPAYLALGYLPLVSAQYSTGIGGSNAQATLVEFFNEMVFYGFQVNSIAEVVLFFIAPLFAFYMINKNLFSVGFESFEERLNRDTWNSRDEDIPSGLKGVALAVAFITVQVVGVLGTFMLLVGAALAYGAWILNWVGLFGDFSNGESSSGNIEEAERDVEEAGQELESSGAEEQEAEKEGNPAEALDAQKGIEHAVSDLEEAEADLENFIERDREEVDLAVKEAENFVEDEREEFSGLKDFEEKATTIVETIAFLADSVESGAVDSINIEDAVEQFDQNVAQNFEVLKSDVQRLNSIAKDMEELGEDEFNRLVRIVQDYNEARKVVQVVEEEIGKAESEEEFMEKLSRELGNQNLSEETQRTEQEIEALAEAYNDIKKALNDQEKGIKRAKKLLEEELDIGRKDLSELKDLKNNIIPEMENHIERLRQGIKTSYSQTSGSNNEYEALLSRVNNLEQELGQVRSMIERIVDEEAKLFERTSEFLSDLRHALKRDKKFD